MPEFNIKISELNPFTPSVSTEDFFPLVDSSSMTTFRATVENIGSLMTHSIYSDTASYAGNAMTATSASWSSSSISASYASSASFAINATPTVSASWTSMSLVAFQSLVSTQSLYATYSIRASLADNSDNVYFSGSKGYYPIWNGTINPADGLVEGGANGNLTFGSQLFEGPSPGWLGGEVVFVDSGSSTLDTYPFDTAGSIRRNVTMSIYNPMANQVGYSWIAAGINTYWPIISDNFVGTDQMFYTWTHAWPPSPNIYKSQSFVRDYFSGSTPVGISGSWEMFNSTTNKLSDVLNDHWVRLVSMADNGGWGEYSGLKPVSDHASLGERSGGGIAGMEGIVRIQITTSGSNANHVVYMILSDYYNAGYMTAQVLQSSVYTTQIIKEIRMYQGVGGAFDPGISLDIKIDNLNVADGLIIITCQSWGGVLFLKYPNVDPWPPVVTGSNDITLSPNLLIFPAAPGFYTNLPKNQNYYIQGQNVVITPTYNQITQSGAFHAENASPYSLNVSGTVNATSKFYCNDSPGLTTTVTYGTNILYFSGGILVGKSPP